MFPKADRDRGKRKRKQRRKIVRRGEGEHLTAYAHDTIEG
jgi:hypothetical protein